MDLVGSVKPSFGAACAVLVMPPCPGKGSDDASKLVMPPCPGKGSDGAAEESVV